MSEPVFIETSVHPKFLTIMSTISIEIPNSLHKHVERLAANDGISVDQTPATALTPRQTQTAPLARRPCRRVLTSCK